MGENTNQLRHGESQRVPAGAPGHPAERAERLCGQCNGETLSAADTEEYSQHSSRFHKRCKLGGKQTDHYLPRVAQENRIFMMKYPDKVEHMLQQARRIRRKNGAKRGKQPQVVTTPPEQELPEVLELPRRGEPTAKHKEEPYAEDTPPDWGEATQTRAQQRVGEGGAVTKWGGPNKPPVAIAWGPAGRPSTQAEAVACSQNEHQNRRGSRQQSRRDRPSR
ncbi:unnamed protein product [Symbiodinium sp. CCMP2592]|nr:unnamed protein product [Symbiodinium sp. CCMP2592]